jgi:preprotein translocase subunit SecG
MTLLFVILIILASVILGLIVLIQNPKGGGLSGNIAGFSNQFMGVKQTTDVVVSVVFMPKNASTGVEDRLNQATGTGIPAPKPATQPATQPPAPAPAPATPASGSK